MKCEAEIQWKGAISVLLLSFGLIFYSYWDTFEHLFSLWSDFDNGEYAHGWLIVAVVVYLVWDKRLVLARMQPRLDFRPVVFFPFIGLFWLIGALIDTNLLQIISVILILMLSVWFALGYRVAKELLFAMLFIFFATPVWLPLQTIFQTFTVHAVYQMLVVMDIPVIRDGYLLTIPEGSFAVLEACSGLRYFLVAFALSTLFSYLNFYRFKIRLLYVLLFLMASLLANWLRVFVVIYAGHLTQMEHPYIHDHANLGWYIFLVMIVGLYWFGYKYLPKWDVPPPEKEKRPERGSGQFMTVPAKGAALLLVLTLLVAPPVLSAYLGGSVKALPDGLNMPDMGEWVVLPASPSELLLPDYKLADLTIGAAYQGRLETVQAAVSFYSSSRRGVSLIDHANQITDGAQWSSLTSEKSRQVSGGKIKEVVVRPLTGSERVVWYWYRVGGQNATDKYEAKMFEVFGVLTGRPDGALIMISADYNINPDEARAVLSSFYEVARPSLDGFVDDLAGG